MFSRLFGIWNLIPSSGEKKPKTLQYYTTQIMLENTINEDGIRFQIPKRRENMFFTNVVMENARNKLLNYIKRSLNHLQLLVRVSIDRGEEEINVVVLTADLEKTFSILGYTSTGVHTCVYVIGFGSSVTLHSSHQLTPTMDVLSWLLMAFATIPRDLKMSYDNVETMSRVKYWSFKDLTVHQLFDKVARENRYKTAFRRGFETWSFYMVQDYSLKVANYFYMAGLHRGDVVALAGVEGPQSMGVWLGLSRLGVATALLPPDLSPADMVLAASKVFSKAVICSPALASELKQQNIPEFMTLFSLGASTDKTVKNIMKEIDGSPSKPIKKYNMSVFNKLLYLFSPNTLIPMPVTNYRYIYIATIIRKTLDLTSKDVVYSPMHQSTSDGSVVATGQAVIFGNRVVSGENPTATTYFPECDHYSATVALYNTGIVKQLQALPPSETDGKHKVRLFAGSGIRDPATWTQVKDRFKIRNIGEYYITVDSDNYNMVNSNSKPGAIGFLPWFSPLRKVRLVAFDPNTGEEVRNEKGLCVSPARGQPGILIDEMPKDFARIHFSKNKKRINDVFKKGDKYINIGDILKKDERGYYFYVDTIDNIKGKVQP